MNLSGFPANSLNIVPRAVSFQNQRLDIALAGLLVEE